jgi:hypothetical protein
MEGYPSSAKSFSHSSFSEVGELYRGVREITPLARTLPARWPWHPRPPRLFSLGVGRRFPVRSRVIFGGCLEGLHSIGKADRASAAAQCRFMVRLLFRECSAQRAFFPRSRGRCWRRSANSLLPYRGGP